jgi:hypothetical protein
MAKRFHEASGSTAKSLGGGVFLAKIIQPGWNLSGTRYYSEDLLKNYGPITFREGRPCFANHPSEEEFKNGRDITKIWGRVVENPEYMEDGDDGPGLYAPVKVRSEYVDFVEEYKDSIGMSIFASGEGQEGEAEGRRGMIVESFDDTDPYTSVDFVVAAGAGGKVQKMLESFQAIEALSGDRREQLNNLVKDAYSGDNTYAWVRDFDDEKGVVYFDVESNGAYGIYSQSYSVDNGVAVQLEGDRIEVRAQTSYVPVNENEPTKENGMTPEEKAELVATIVAQVTEALKPAPKVDDEDTPKAATPAEVAEAVREAGLPKASEKRVFESLADGATADDVAAAITREKEFAEALLKDAEADEVPGRVRESHTGEAGTYVSAWGR